MSPVTLEYFQHPNYWETGTIAVTTPAEGLEEAARLLRSLYSGFEHPVMLSFIKPGGEELRLGHGGEESTLILVRNGDEFYYSVGDPTRTGTAVYLCPEWTEISAKRLIPHEQAQRALELWFEGKDVSQAVQVTGDLP